jgi:hypothetical protein
MVQALLTPKEDAATEAFQKFADKTFPFRARQEARDKKTQEEILKDWTAGGPISVVAQEDLTPRKAKQRVRKVEEINVARKSLLDTGRLVDLGDLGPPKNITAGSARLARARRAARRQRRKGTT